MTRIEAGQIWRHFKGDRYKILGVVPDCGSGEPLVRYTRTGCVDLVWVRPQKEFLETIEADISVAFVDGLVCSRGGWKVPRFCLEV